MLRGAARGLNVSVLSCATSCTVTTPARDLFIGSSPVPKTYCDEHVLRTLYSRLHHLINVSTVTEWLSILYIAVYSRSQSPIVPLLYPQLFLSHCKG